MLSACHEDVTDGEDLLTAGRALEQYLFITRNAGPILEVVEHRALIDGCLRFRGCAMRCGIRLRPKHHLYIHLVHAARRFGNPRVWTSTWEDESLNSTLAAVARGAHPWVWSRRILATFAHNLGPESQKRARRA